ncbi:CGNR zinc finger domain-containing protein [Kitasatospora sp. DSM 101779]|jgi:predicted RNA-binding Zn ribbon-like protein|uniref:CGNR zinc finger domain-containing protein n=1 Tax=Kitasatospora sp. DSM 101779 TaxID=2853165 RepID=UPI0021DA383F|nr:CGNR zinc finger domain-containing protein [Kitasatospora sp. DSM 101779]MCU7823624.1 CGNR zinc finger domain-containing protein [Kitasatospora sp. DSM 101779]
MADPRDPRPLIGEPLALDLLNTRWRNGQQDLLADLDGYRIWLSSAGLADRCPADEASLTAVKAARGALDLLVADPGSTEGAAALNAVLAHGRVRHSLGPDGPAETAEADPPQQLAAWLAADDYLSLLRRGAHRIKQCAHPACILHFFDTSQNGRRRWCSMALCGNRSKAARHYERTVRAESAAQRLP